MYQVIATFNAHVWVEFATCEYEALVLMLAFEEFQFLKSVEIIPPVVGA